MIGIFDTGVGGLSVLRACQQAFPQEDFLYYADTARAPYGNLTPEAIVRNTQECAEHLLKYEIKGFVIACFTASCYASQLKLPIPIITMFDALPQLMTDQFTLLATRATIQSQCFQKHYPQIAITPVACPLLAPLVEEGWIDHPATELVTREYLSSIPLSSPLFLGCTHYTFLSHHFRNHTLIDTTPLVAEKLRPLIPPSLRTGSTRFLTTSDPKRFQAIASTLFKPPALLAPSS